jgi:CheY-like chemotaxis protein
MNGKRILLVEDQRVVRESLRLLFSCDAHTVIEANNGAEALAIFRTGKFDLVVTDFEMPFIKGNELAMRIKQLVPKQRILMITAYGHRRSSDNPVDAVLAKPFNATLLREAMARVLRRPGEDSKTELITKSRAASPKTDSISV